MLTTVTVLAANLPTSMALSRANRSIRRRSEHCFVPAASHGAFSKVSGIVADGGELLPFCNDGPFTAGLANPREQQ